MLIIKGLKWIKNSSSGKHILRLMCLLIMMVVMITFVFVSIIGSILGNIFGLFFAERESKAVPPQVVISADLYQLYKEVEDVYEVPWTLVAGIHAVNTRLALPPLSVFSEFSDAMDLSDEVWEENKQSRERYWCTVGCEEELEESLDLASGSFNACQSGCEEIEDEDEDGEGRESCYATCEISYQDSVANANQQFNQCQTACLNFVPSRDEIGDLIFTCAAYFSSFYTEERNDRELDKLIREIVHSRDDMDTVKLMIWLLQTQYGRAGWPVEDKYGQAFITSQYGYRTDPITGERTFHHGTDIAPPLGEPVFAFADGVVQYAGSAEGYGTLILIEHESYERKDGTVASIQTLYAHSQGLMVREGDQVIGGQQIAEIGNEGRSTGPHLHFEVIIISSGERDDPMNYLVTPEEIGE